MANRPVRAKSLGLKQVWTGRPIRPN